MLSCACWLPLLQIWLDLWLPATLNPKTIDAEAYNLSFGRSNVECHAAVHKPSAWKALAEPWMTNGLWWESRCIKGTYCSG